MHKVVATFILSALVIVLGSACEPDNGPQEKPKPAKKQEQPAKKPAKQPAKQEQPDLGLPKLTGNRAKDKKAVQSALVSLKTEWDNNSKLLKEMLGDKKPDPKRVAQLKKKNVAYQQRAEKLQEMLDKLRQ